MAIAPQLSERARDRPSIQAASLGQVIALEMWPGLAIATPAIESHQRVIVIVGGQYIPSRANVSALCGVSSQWCFDSCLMMLRRFNFIGCMSASVPVVTADGQRLSAHIVP
ncbi:MAG: hypothetical protein AAGF98_01645, partial [Cyanobacteria bacterium P01_H01_bin.153]